MSLVQQIRDALRDSEGMTTQQLADALGEDSKRIGMTCSERKQAGQFVSRREDGGVVYALNPDGAAPKPKAYRNQNAEARRRRATGVMAKKPKLERAQQAPTQRKRDFLAACESDEKTLKALTFAASTADDALEVYLYSVVDPAIYEALKKSSAQMHAAVVAFTSQGESA